MATTSLIDLPYELQVMVVAFLGQHELAVCVRVCRPWKMFFRPYLWKHIVIDWDDDPGRQEDISDALRANAHLVESLNLRSSGHYDLKSFLWHCGRYKFPNLTCGEVVGSFYMVSDEEIALFVDLPGAKWRKLVFSLLKDEGYDGFRFKSRTSNAIRRHARTLEVICFNGECEIKSCYINRLLRWTINLKELRFSHRRRLSWGRGMLDAEEIGESNWACHNLEVFECMIGGIQRPDIDSDKLRNAPNIYVTGGTPLESKLTQQQIYTKLARLTKLRELTLGSPVDPEEYSRSTQRDIEYHQQYDGLAMTVDSGLDLLKGLKELRLVDLSGMELYFDGDKEETWFKENWPNAKVIISRRDTNVVNQDSP